MVMGAEAAAIAAAIAKATKASGVVVKMDPEDFLNILNKAGKCLVVCATGGFISTNYQYLTSYKGLAFFTKSDEPLVLPPGVETVLAEDIWIPG
ncbi:MAG: hypothetical protein C5B55_11225 [Blastocatellia bacterium]|nr:MAG: hypothetical protein C5B55_11225 [Blastocatellia bacterium]